MNYVATKATVKVVEEWVDSDGITRQLVSIKGRFKRVRDFWELYNDNKRDSN